MVVLETGGDNSYGHVYVGGKISLGATIKNRNKITCVLGQLKVKTEIKTWGGGGLELEIESY